MKPEENYNLDAELAVLSAILNDEKAITSVKDADLKPEDFGDQEYRKIFRAALKIKKGGDPIDIVTMTRFFKDQENGKSHITSAKLVEIANSHFTTANLDFHVREIIKASQRRIYGGDIDLKFRQLKREKDRLNRPGKKKVLSDIPEDCIFWRLEEWNDNRKIKIDRLNFINFLEFLKIGRMRTINGYAFILNSDNKIREINKVEIKDRVVSYIKKLPEEIGEITKSELLSALMNYSNIIFCDHNLEFIDYVEIEIKKDTQETAWRYYRNCIVEITKNGVKTINYQEFEGQIWQNQVIDREYKQEENFKDCEFYKFIGNISNNNRERIESFISILGYLLHGYKNQAETRAVIFMDEILSEDGEANGRTGKSLVGKALKHAVNITRLDGRNFKFNKNFALQSVNYDTQVVNFDDVDSDFDFERLLSMITDDMTIEKKNRDEFIIPFDESPKFLISTNYVIKGSGASFEGRRIEFEFSNHYNLANTPEMEFGHLFFSGWDSEEWNRFDNFLAYCIGEYLKFGLLTYNQIHVDEKRFLSETSPEFKIFADNRIKKYFIDNPEFISNEWDKKELFNLFTDEFEDFKDKLKQRTFTRWLRKYGKYVGYQMDERRSHGGSYIKFIRT